MKFKQYIGPQKAWC